MAEVTLVTDSKSQLRSLAMLRGQPTSVCSVLSELAQSVLMAQESYLRRFDAKAALTHLAWMVEKYSADVQHGDVVALTFRAVSLVLEFVPSAYDAAVDYHKALARAASACLHRGLCGQWRHDLSDARALIEECLRTIKFVARDDVTGGILRYLGVGDLLTVCADKDAFLARQALETLAMLCGKVVMPTAFEKTTRKSGFFAFFRSKKSHHGGGGGGSGGSHSYSSASSKSSKSSSVHTARPSTAQQQQPSSSSLSVRHHVARSSSSSGGGGGSGGGSPANSLGESNLAATSNSNNARLPHPTSASLSSSLSVARSPHGVTSRLIAIPRWYSNNNNNSAGGGSGSSDGGGHSVDADAVAVVVSHSIDKSSTSTSSSGGGGGGVRGGDGGGSPYFYYTPTSPRAANSDHPIVVQVERVMAPFLVALAEQLAGHLVEAPETWSRLELTLHCIDSLVERALLCHRGSTARSLVPPALPLLLFRLMNVLMDEGAMVLDATVRAERVLLCETLLSACTHCHREGMLESLLSAPARRFFHRLLDASREEITTLLNDPFAHNSSNSNNNNSNNGASGTGGGGGEHHEGRGGGEAGEHVDAAPVNMRRRDRNQMTCVAALRLLLLACPDVPVEAYGPRPRVVLPVHMWSWDDELRHPNRFSEDNCVLIEAAWQRLCRCTMVHSVARQLSVDLQLMLMNRDIRGAQRNVTRRPVPFVFHFVAESTVRPEVAVKQTGPTHTPGTAAAAGVAESVGGGGGGGSLLSHALRPRPRTTASSTEHHAGRRPPPHHGRHRSDDAASAAAAAAMLAARCAATHVAVAREYLELLCGCAVHMTGQVARQMTTCTCASVLRMALCACDAPASAAALLVERAMRPLCEVFREGLSSSDKTSKAIVLSMMEWLLVPRGNRAAARGFCVAAFRSGLHYELEVQATLAARSANHPTQPPAPSSPSPSSSSSSGAAAAAARAMTRTMVSTTTSSLPPSAVAAATTAPVPAATNFAFTATSSAAVAMAMQMVARRGGRSSGSGSGDARVVGTADTSASSPSQRVAATTAAVSRTMWIAQHARRLCAQMLSEVQTMSLATATHPAAMRLQSSSLSSSSSSSSSSYALSSSSSSSVHLRLSAEAVQLRAAADALDRVAGAPGEHVAELRDVFDVLRRVRDVTAFEVHHMDVAGTLLRYVLGGRRVDELVGPCVIYASGGYGSTRSPHIAAAAARQTTPLAERSPWVRLMAQGMGMREVLRCNADAARLRCLCEAGVASPTAVRRLIVYLVHALPLQAHLPLVESAVTYDAVVCRTPQRAFQLMYACTPLVQLCARPHHEDAGGAGACGGAGAAAAAAAADGDGEQQTPRAHTIAVTTTTTAAAAAATTMVAYEGVVCCARGHELTETRRAPQPIVCDACGRTLGDAYSCRRCNYDLCAACWAERRARQRHGGGAADAGGTRGLSSTAYAPPPAAAATTTTTTTTGAASARTTTTTATASAAAAAAAAAASDVPAPAPPAAARSHPPPRSEHAHLLACVGDVERWFRTGSTSTKATQTAPTTQSALTHVRPFTDRVRAFLRRYEDDVALGELVRKLLAHTSTLRRLVADVLRSHKTAASSSHGNGSLAATTATATTATTSSSSGGDKGNGGSSSADYGVDEAVLTGNELVLARVLLQEAIETRYVLYRPLLGACAYQETLFSVLYRHAVATGNKRMLVSLENVLMQHAHSAEPLTLSDDVARDDDDDDDGDSGGGGGGGGGGAAVHLSAREQSPSRNVAASPAATPSSSPAAEAWSDDYTVTSAMRFVFHHSERDECTYCACGAHTRAHLATTATPRLVRTLPSLAHRSDMLLLILLHALFVGTQTAPCEATLPPPTTTTTTAERDAANNKNNVVDDDGNGRDEGDSAGAAKTRSGSKSNNKSNKNNDDDGGDGGGDAGLFISTAITAAVVRAFEASALRVSALPPEYALPRWTAFVLRDARFLLPRRVRVKLARFVACDARRALVKHVRRYRAFRELRGAAIVPAEWARLSNHKFVVRRDHFLHDAARSLGKCADARLPVSFEFAGEAGMGQGPTAQFYTMLAREVCRPRLRMWREGDGDGADRHTTARRCADDDDDDDNKDHGDQHNDNGGRSCVGNSAAEHTTSPPTSTTSMRVAVVGKGSRDAATPATRVRRVRGLASTSMHTVPSVAELTARTRATATASGTTTAAAAATAAVTRATTTATAATRATTTTTTTTATAAARREAGEAVEAFVVAPAEGLYPRPFDDLAVSLRGGDSGSGAAEMAVTSSPRGASGAVVTLCDRTRVLLDLVMEQQERASAYYAVGAALGRAFLDAQVFPLPLSPAVALFLRRGLPPHRMDCDAAVAHTAALHRSIDVFALATDVLRLVDGGVWHSLVALRTLDAATLRALDLPFTLPGRDDVELIDGGAHTYVDATRLSLFERRVTAMLVYESVTLPLRLLTRGCHDVVPREALAMLEEEEVVGLVCGDARRDDAPLWTLQEIRGVLVGDHGYDATSPQLGMLARVLGSRLTPHEQRLFLQFCTGCPRLPMGGVAALGAITVVRRSNAFDRTLTAAMRVAQRDDAMDDDEGSGGGGGGGGGGEEGHVGEGGGGSGSGGGDDDDDNNDGTAAAAVATSSHPPPEHTTTTTATMGNNEDDDDDDDDSDARRREQQSPLCGTRRDALSRAAAAVCTSSDEVSMGGLLGGRDDAAPASGRTPAEGRPGVPSVLGSSMRSVGSAGSGVMNDSRSSLASSLSLLSSAAGAAATAMARRSGASVASQQTMLSSLPASEWALPSVNTCFRYLKLPPYPDEEMMYSKLLLSITQSGDRFELS